MPHPQTGFFVEPGSSQDGFIRPLHDTRSRASSLDELASNARQRLQDKSLRVLQALNGSDPLLYPISSQVRPRVAGILQRYAVKLREARANPELKFMSPAGIERYEASIHRDYRDLPLADLHADLTKRLEAVTTRLEQRLADLRTGRVTDEMMEEAHALADRLSRLTPDEGVDELVEFFDQVGVGERDRGELVALLPVLRSAHQTAGSAWSGSRDLERLVSIGESLIDGGWAADVTEARLNRAQRLGGDLETFMYLAKTDPTTLNAHVVQAMDENGTREPGGYALFPEEAEPIGPAIEDGEGDPLDLRRGGPAATDVRRGAMTSERREADRAARAAQA